MLRNIQLIWRSSKLGNGQDSKKGFLRHDLVKYYIESAEQGVYYWKHN